MKLLLRLHWPKQLITTSASRSPLQAPQLLQCHQCSVSSLRASCIALQIVSMDLICRLKFLLQTRLLVIKKCFHKFICEEAKQLTLLLVIPYPTSVQLSLCYVIAEVYSQF